MGTTVQQNNNMGYPIYLYTTPTANQNKIWKRTVDIIGHWAICINGYCYELTRVTPSEKESGIEVKYWIRYLPEQEWKRVKQQEGRRITERDPLGYTARPWSHADIKHIAELIWDGPLQKNYEYDRNNCQVFVRLLVDLVGDNAVKINFPALFTEKVKDAGVARDLTYFALTGAVIGASSVAAGTSLLFAPADWTGTLGAFGIAAGGLALKATDELWESRIVRAKYIEEAQAKLRAQLIREGIFS